MAGTSRPDFGEELLKQDKPLKESDYKEYRMRLEDSLNRAERNERLVGRIVIICFVLAFVLMFVGGSQVLGSFDPWDNDATIFSVTLGVVYVVALVAAWVGLASYFSRFRPRTREAKENIRDAHMLDLERQIQVLRSEIKEATKQG
jgi:hypothetical protein